jgi:hypothetical protein
MKSASNKVKAVVIYGAESITMQGYIFSPGRTFCGGTGQQPPLPPFPCQGTLSSHQISKAGTVTSHCLPSHSLGATPRVTAPPAAVTRAQRPATSPVKAPKPMFPPRPTHSAGLRTAPRPMDDPFSTEAITSPSVSTSF